MKKYVISLALIFTAQCIADSKLNPINNPRIDQLSMGGFSGGGGATGVYINDKLIIIDLITIPQLRDLTFEILKQNQTKVIDAMSEAQELLQKWDHVTMSIGSAQALTTFQSIKWSFVNNDFSLLPRFYPIEDVIYSNPVTVAYYSKDNMQTEISNNSFSKMIPISQAATIIHESLRHVQIGWNKDNNGFNELALQEATAIFVLCKPNNVMAQYINFLLHNLREQALIQFNGLENLINSHCKKAY